MYGKVNVHAYYHKCKHSTYSYFCTQVPVDQISKQKELPYVAHPVPTHPILKDLLLKKNLGETEPLGQLTQLEIAPLFRYI